MIALSITLPPLVHGDTALWQRVMLKFEERAGDLIVKAVQKHLGQSDLYTLTQRYSAKKIAGKTKPRMKPFPGKAPDEPLILSGAMVEALGFRMEGSSTLVVQVIEGLALSKDGDDYPEAWEEKVHYLEAGFDDVKDDLAALLGEIIMVEMLLGD